MDKCIYICSDLIYFSCNDFCFLTILIDDRNCQELSKEMPRKNEKYGEFCF